MNLLRFEGYHGTDEAHTESIQINNFNPSISDEHWLGNGTYFFIDGIPNDRKPETAAANWAQATAWDKRTKRYLYLKYTVFKTIIDVNEDYLIDLTSPEGMEIFNYYRRKFNDELSKKSKRTFKKDSPIFRDGELINELRQRKGLRVDAVIGNFYIKFTSERMNQLDFRVPNCTIIAIFNAPVNIDKTAIKIISKSKV
jgi:hypothetical protein